VPIEYAAGNARLKPIAPDAVGLLEVDQGRQKTALKSVASATLSQGKCAQTFTPAQASAIIARKTMRGSEIGD
jgi:hypothetical protein